MTKSNFYYLCVSFLLSIATTPTHALVLNSLDSVGIINQCDSSGHNNGMWIYTSDGMYEDTYICSYNDRGNREGLGIELVKKDDGSYRISSLELNQNNLMVKRVDFYNNGKAASVMDSVQPLDTKKFPKVGIIAEKCKNTEIGRYGIIQFYAKGYNEDTGLLEVEGWYCNFIDENKNYDYMANPLEIGIHKYYKDGEVILKDYTDISIQILLNIAGLGDDDD